MIPKLTVLMPVYNCRAYIEESVNSILNQTFTDFELIIIDDASTDGTPEIINKFKDSRICLIIKTENKGYTDSLNIGLKLAKGIYIARMDGDDVSLPERFVKQVNFLDKNPEIILCGTGTQILGTNKIVYFPDTHEKIKINLILGNTIAHPTVMLRNVTLKQYNLEYDPNMEPAEDYDLWTRMVFLGKIANLSEVLLLYRVHNNQISNVKSELQIKKTQIVRRRMLQHLIPETPEEFSPFELKYNRNKNKSRLKELKKGICYMDKLILENNKKGIYDPTLFLSYIEARKANLPVLLLRKPYSPFVFIDILLFMPYLFYNIGIIGSINYTFKYFLKAIGINAFRTT